MTSDERTIRSLEEQEVVAVLNQDVAALERLMSERIIVNNPQNGITPDREGVLDRVRKGLIRYSSFERRIEAIRIDGDVAIVMGLEVVVPKGGAPRAGETVRRRYTNIWKRSGSGWKSIARHANVVAGTS
jgi:ketosteroid isomerase-like protein